MVPETITVPAGEPKAVFGVNGPGETLVFFRVFALDFVLRIDRAGEHINLWNPAMRFIMTLRF